LFIAICQPADPYGVAVTDSLFLLLGAIQRGDCMYIDEMPQEQEGHNMYLMKESAATAALNRLWY
jgi:hypothetical protein